MDHIYFIPQLTEFMKDIFYFLWSLLSLWYSLCYMVAAVDDGLSSATLDQTIYYLHYLIGPLFDDPPSCSWTTKNNSIKPSSSLYSSTVSNPMSEIQGPDSPLFL